MPFIRETIVTTVNADGSAHIAPLGVIEDAHYLTIAPFHPSTTLDNLRRTPKACVNYTVDVRVFAGCVTRRKRDWPVVPTGDGGWRLDRALAHSEVEVAEVVEDELRPRFRCRIAREVAHGTFLGFNRAQAAVVEAAILVSRLQMLPREKIEAELSYLAIAVGKTAGEAEAEAWGWIVEHCRAAGFTVPTG